MKKLGLLFLCFISCSKVEISTSNYSFDKNNVVIEELSSKVYTKFFPSSKSVLTKADSYMISDCYFVTNYNPGFVIAYYDSLSFQPLVISEKGRYQNGSTGNDAFDMCIESAMVTFVGGGGGGPQITDDHYVSSTTHLEKGVNPLCTVEWNQRQPFNWYCSNPYNYDVPAGCVPIAILQAMQVFSYPDEVNLSYLDNRTIQIPWDDMSSMPSYPSQTTESIAAAHLSREIGERVNVVYNVTSHGGSGAHMEDVPDCLSSFNYYSSSLDNYDFSRVISSVDEESPVIISGVASNNRGHAWLVDGYLEEIDSTRWTRVGSHHFPIDAGYEVTKSWYLHFNFGWGGQDNTFVLSRKDYFGDAELLLNPPISQTLVSMFSGNFTSNCRIITNIKPNEL